MAGIQKHAWDETFKFDLEKFQERQKWMIIHNFEMMYTPNQRSKSARELIAYANGMNVNLTTYTKV